MARTTTYPLRLAASIKASAVAQKPAALPTATYVADRRARADWSAFDRLMQRSSGEPPRANDEPASDA